MTGLPRTRTTTAAAVIVMLAAAPPFLGGLLTTTIGLPFALGLGSIVDAVAPMDGGGSPTRGGVMFGLTMVVPGLLAAAFGAVGAAGGWGLLACRSWARGASLTYGALLAATGLSMIVLGDTSTGLVGSAVLGAGTVLLSILPLPSIREDLERAGAVVEEARRRERRAL